MANQLEYLNVYNAHTGGVLRVPKPLRFHNLLDFKTYIYEHFTNYIAGSTDNIFLVTAFGIKLNFAMVNSMSEVYMFDKRLFVQGDFDVIYEKYLQLSEPHPPEVLSPKPYEPSLGSGDDYEKICSALKVCDGWTKALVQNGHHINDKIDQYIKQTNAIFMALSIIFEFTTNYIRDIKKYFDNHQNHIKLLSMKSIHGSWREYYLDLRRFPDFRLHLAHVVRLSELVNQSELEISAAYIGKYLPAIVDRFNRFSQDASRVSMQQLDVDRTIEQLRKASIDQFKDLEATKSMYISEVEKLRDQIAADSETVTASNAKTVYSRQMERGNTLFSEVNNRFKLLQSLYEFKCKLGKDCIPIFEKLGSLQKTMVQIKNDVKSLISDRTEESLSFESLALDGPIDSRTISRIQLAEDHLSLTTELPFLFGLMLIEKRRQYEWHNFFMKGVVHNTSEQLTMIIKHERDYQKLWIRKYSRLIKFIASSISFHIQLPSIDISAVNGQLLFRSDSILAAIGDSAIEREDISRYIQIVRDQKNGSSASDNLDKNYESLIVSTDNLKQITKIIATLSSFASLNNLKVVLQKEDGNNSGNQVYDVDHDKDLNVINGLRSRIRCLESLLHQRQYQELLSWPVLRNSGVRSPDNRQSMLLLAPSRSKSVTTSSDHSKSTHHRRSSTGRSLTIESSKVLDASVTIDKHLDNIRLRREKSDLIATNGLLLKENESLQAEIASLRAQLEKKDRDVHILRTDFEGKFAITENTIQELGNRHEEELQALQKTKTEEINKLEADNLHLRGEIDDLNKLVENRKNDTNHAEELDQEISNLTAELSDLKIANSELSRKFQARELELTNSIDQLKLQVTQLSSETEQKVTEGTQSLEAARKEISALNSSLGLQNVIVCELLNHISLVVGRNIEFFKEFCFVLESMGLLLVTDNDSEKHDLKITRVKGLRTKKGTENLDENTLKGRTIPHTEVYPKIIELANWTDEVTLEVNKLNSGAENQRKQSTEVAEQLRQLVARFFEDNDEVSAFTKFLTAIAFTENAQLQTQYSDVEVVNRKFFLNGISKRFLDVEGFAKKLTKENKQKEHELAKWMELCKSKITVNNFAPGDLVLFLPVRIEGAVDEAQESITPWTAFNIDSPHYLLDYDNYHSLSNKDWFVSRVKEITKHQVSDQTVGDRKQNPFALEVGNVWFMIYTA